MRHDESAASVVSSQGGGWSGGHRRAGLVQRYQGLGSAARHQIAESEQHESSMHARHEVGFSLVTTFWRNEHSR
jgi:hypothetical protein